MGRVVTLQHAPEDAKVRARFGTVSTLDAFVCNQMALLESVVSNIVRDPAGNPPSQTEDAIRRVRETSRPTWWTLGGGVLLAVCVTLQVVFALPGAVLAAIVYVAIWAMRLATSAVKLPKLYSVIVQVVGGAFVGAVSVAFGLVSAGAAVAAVAVNWMLLVPLAQLVSSVVEWVDSYTQSALVRAASFVMTCAGVVIGAAAALLIVRDPAQGQAIPIDLPTLPLIAILTFSLLGAVGNAFANAGGADLLLPAAVVGVGTASLQQLQLHVLEVPAVWASGITATILGLVCALWAQRSAYSSTALALVGLTGALLPGLTVYQGIAATMSGVPSGDHFGQAALVGTALGIGTALGFTLARMIVRAATNHTAQSA